MKFSDRVRSMSDNLDLFQSSENNYDLRELLDCCQQVNAKLARLLNDQDHLIGDQLGPKGNDPDIPDDPRIQKYIDRAEEYFKDWEEAQEGTIRRQIVDLLLPLIRDRRPLAGDPSPRQQEEIDSFYRKMLTEILNQLSPFDTLDKLLDLDKKIQGEIEDSTIEQKQVVPKLQGFINNQSNKILAAINPAAGKGCIYSPFSDISELLDCCSHLIEIIEQCKGKLCSSISSTRVCNDNDEILITIPPSLVPNIEDIVRRFSS